MLPQHQINNNHCRSLSRRENTCQYFFKFQEFYKFWFSFKKMLSKKFQKDANLHQMGVKFITETHVERPSSNHLCFKLCKFPIKVSWMGTFFPFLLINRSSRPEMFLKILRKRQEKHLYKSLFFKKTLWYRCFLVNFARFLRTTFSIEHLQLLFLNSNLSSLIFLQ